MIGALRRWFGRFTARTATPPAWSDVEPVFEPAPRPEPVEPEHRCLGPALAPDHRIALPGEHPASRERDVTRRRHPAPVAVIDCSDRGLGQAQAHELSVAGIQADLATPLALLHTFAAVVIVLPLDPPAAGSSGAVLRNAVATAAEQRTAPSAPVVLAWVVDANARAAAAVAVPGHNLAPLLLGGAWRRELLEQDDPAWAAALRSVAIGRIAAAMKKAEDAEPVNAETIALVRKLDEYPTHSLLCLHPDSDRPGGVLEWESTIATVRSLLPTTSDVSGHGDHDGPSIRNLGHWA